QFGRLFFSFCRPGVRSAERLYGYSLSASAEGGNHPGKAMLRKYSQSADRVWPTRLQRIADPEQNDIPVTAYLAAPHLERSASRPSSQSLSHARARLLVPPK